MRDRKNKMKNHSKHDLERICKSGSLSAAAAAYELERRGFVAPPSMRTPFNVR